MTESQLTLRERLEQPGAFVVAAALVMSRGLLTADGGAGARVLGLARGLVADPRLA